MNTPTYLILAGPDGSRILHTYWPATKARGLQELDEFLAGTHKTANARSSRPVGVFFVNIEVYHAWCDLREKETGKRPGSLGIEGDPSEFPSAMDASRHLGFNYNIVSRGLSEAKQRGDDYEEFGVAWRFVEDLPG
jgi:hypothetical protein